MESCRNRIAVLTFCLFYLLCSLWLSYFHFLRSQICNSLKIAVQSWGKPHGHSSFRLN
jgi:hypothetical protein